MKTFINRMRWLSAGIYLGVFIAAWIMGEDEKKKLDKKFNDITSKYNDPEWISEKMYGEEHA